MLELQWFLKKLKKSWYSRPISIKLDFKPSELASKEKLRKQLKKVKAYYDKYFINLVDSDDEDDNDEKNTEPEKNHTEDKVEEKREESINDTKKWNEIHEHEEKADSQDDVVKEENSENKENK